MAQPIWLLATGAALLLAGMAFSKEESADDPLPLRVADFPSWYKANPKPYFISSQLDLLCRMATPEELARQAKDPHVHKFVTVYANRTAEATMRKGGVFPEGSMIVKKKFLAPGWTTSRTAESIKDPEPDIATVMIKRNKGFNPKCGDWEFAVLDKSGEKVTAQGKLETCMSCHASKAKSDCVYRTYVDGS